MIGEMDMGHDGRIQMSHLDAACSQTVGRDRFPAENIRADDAGLEMFGRNRAGADMAGLDGFVCNRAGFHAKPGKMAAADRSCADVLRPDASAAMISPPTERGASLLAVTLASASFSDVTEADSSCPVPTLPP
ncbi:hypothetical protein CM49_02830 [Paenibacillus sp. P1XP2]|nr:hypothetical protein CM49_02830 [Paenibacillus sp. P1XP2]